MREMDEEIIFKPAAFKQRTGHDTKFREMTDEEAECLDGLWTRTTPEIDVNRPGYFARKGLVLGEVASDVAEYLRARAAVTHRPQAEIINELVREKLAAQAV
jgi:hypothetical protein